MSIVTIVGSSGTSIHVTVGGGKAQDLAEVYAKQMADAFARDKLTTVLLAPDTATPHDTEGQVYGGFVTTGGSYAPTGTYDFIGVGALNDASNSTASLNERVTVDGAGISSTGILSVLGGTAAGLTFNAGVSDGSFLAVVGDNYFNGGTQSANWTIVTSDGNDTILATNGTNSIDAGTGNNLILLQQGTNSVVSEGRDTITGGAGGNAFITVQGGNSIVSLGGTAFISDDASIGSLITVGDNSTVQSGNGSTVVFAGANGTLSGAQNDTVSALGDLSVLYGSNQTISVSGSLRFIAGTGSTNISAAQSTLWGANDLSATVSAGDSALWTGNQLGSSSNQLIDASSSQGTLEAWTGAGDQTVIGGQGSDHFVFGTEYDGNTEATYVTVSGGSGAANTFGVLAGHTAGDITITDFAAASGNKFFMYNYKPEDAETAVQSLLATATVQGGNTSIMLDNNMKVTFMGVTDLNSSNIIIS